MLCSKKGGGESMLRRVKKIWARHSRRLFDDNDLIFFLISQDRRCLHVKLKKTAVEQPLPPIITENRHFPPKF